MTFATPDVGEVDFRRDQYGRPVVTQPDGTTLPYTRCSSAAKVLEDMFNLEQWAQRNVAFGMAHDASLVARVLAVGGNPHTWGKDEKAKVRDVVKDAQAAAKAHKAADIGTAVHELTHQLDAGLPVTPGPYRGDLDAYAAASDVAGLVPVPAWIECRIVNDVLRMAGTVDRYYQVAPGPLADALGLAPGAVVVGDIKTGRSVDLAALGFAAQLAAYATGTLYDPTTDTRQPTPVIDRRWGLLVHLPAGTGTCTLYRVDLVKGLAAAHLANAVRNVRKEAKSYLQQQAVA